MTRQLSNTKERYGVLRCPNSQCDNVSSPIYLIEEKLMEGLKEWLGDYELEWKSETHENFDEMLAVVEADIKSQNTKCEQIEQQLSRTYDLLEQGVYDLETFRQRRKALEEKRNALKAELERLQEQRSAIKTKEQAVRNFIPTIQNIIDTYNLVDGADAKNAILREGIERIEYLKTKRTAKGKRDSADIILQIYPRLPVTDLSLFKRIL